MMMHGRAACPNRNRDDPAPNAPLPRALDEEQVELAPAAILVLGERRGGAAAAGNRAGAAHPPPATPLAATPQGELAASAVAAATATSTDEGCGGDRRRSRRIHIACDGLAGSRMLAAWAARYLLTDKDEVTLVHRWPPPLSSACCTAVVRLHYCYIHY